MAVSRLKTWSAGEVLTAADLNAEFDNLITNGGSLAFPRTAAAKFAGYAAVLGSNETEYLQCSTTNLIEMYLASTSLIKFDGRATTPVNGLTFYPNSASSAPQIQAHGSDTDISINLVPKGAGTVQVNGAAIPFAAIPWVDGGGTANAITATYSPAVTALTNGMVVSVRATAANTTTTPTFQANSTTAKTIVKQHNQALVGGDIIGDSHELLLRYAADIDRWVLLNPTYPFPASNLTSPNSTAGLNLLMPANAQTGTSYALIGSDRGKYVTFSNASAIAVSIAAASSIGASWYTTVHNIGAGLVTITPTTSTINGAATLVLSKGQWARIQSDGTNYSALLGGAPSKQTIWIPAGSMTARTTNGAATGTFESTTNKVMNKSLDFDTTTQEYAQFSIALPKGWDEGTVTFQPYWSAASGSGTVAWTLAGVSLSDDDAIDTAFGTAQSSSDTLITALDVHVGPESSAITIAGTPAEGDLTYFQISRDVGNDNLGVDALLLGIKLFITYDTPTDR